MNWALRAGRIAVVIAVVFFLAATAALAGSSRTEPNRKPDCTTSCVHMPTKWVTAPAKVLKETALLHHRVQKAGETALVGFSVNLLSRSIQWFRQLGLAQVKPQGRPRAGGG